MEISKLSAGVVLALTLTACLIAGAAIGKPIGVAAIAAMNSVGCNSRPACVTARNAGSGAAFAGASKSGDGIIAETSAITRDHVIGGVYGYASGSAGPRTVGVLGAAENGSGVLGKSTKKAGVVGETLATVGAHSGVLGEDRSYDDNTANAGVVGTSPRGAGVEGISLYGTGVTGSTQRGNGVSGTGPNAGVAGSSPGGSGVLGSSSSGYGVFGSATYGFGLLGFSTQATGIYATAPVNAGTFTVDYYRSSDPCPNSETLDVCGNYSGDVVAAYALGSSSIFERVMDVDNRGNLTIAGELYTEGSCRNGCARQGERGRHVISYGAREAVPTIEDVGTGHLQNGRVTIALDSEFVNAIDDSAPYHVFVTPQGDSRGLYVTNIGSTHFDVRENQGGRSSLSFDYRIVARPYGDRHARLSVIEDHRGTHRGPVPILPSLRR